MVVVLLREEEFNRYTLQCVTYKFEEVYDMSAKSKLQQGMSGKSESPGDKDVKNIIAGNWTTLIKPSEYSIESLSGSIAVFTVFPLPHGFGMTIGNSLRRVLLSSLYGAAVVAVKIEGVDHEYSTVPGMREDVVDLILNIKQMVLRYGKHEKARLHLNVVGPCVVTAGMIQAHPDIDVVDPGHVLCTLGAGSTLKMDMTVACGRGYVPANENRTHDMELGVIPVDSLFSPVKKVSFKVDNSRVGSDTEYDKLSITVETDGSIAPELAVGLAARIMQEQLQVFVNFKEVNDVVEEEESRLPFDVQLLRKVEDLELSVRSHNCLKNDNIRYIGDLVVKTESEMLRTPNFGRKSLNEIRELLGSLNLRFGMEVQGWPLENIEEVAKEYEEQLN